MTTIALGIGALACTEVSTEIAPEIAAIQEEWRLETPNPFDRGYTVPLCWVTPGWDLQKRRVQELNDARWASVSSISFEWSDSCPTSGPNQVFPFWIKDTTNSDDSCSGQTYLAKEGLRTPTEWTSQVLQTVSHYDWTHDLGPGITYADCMGPDGSEDQRFDGVAVHEFTHTMGSYDPNPSCAGDDPSIIQTTYGCRTENTLTGWDLAGIRAVYGHRFKDTRLVAVNSFSIYRRAAVSQSNAAPTQWAMNNGHGEVTSAVADVNGDGASDFIRWNYESVWVRTSAGAGRVFHPQQVWAGGAFSGGQANLVADVNGDNRADLIAWNPGNVWVRVADPSSNNFQAETQWASEAMGGTRAKLAADANGDGRADLIIWDDNVIKVKLSRQPYETPYPGFKPASTWASDGAFFGTQANLAADINDDGKADLIAVNGAGTVYVRKSSGSSYGPVQPYGYIASPGNRYKAADVNGDDKAELIVWKNDGIDVYYPSGDWLGFVGPANWSTGAFYGQYGNLAADVNGDGRSDLIAVNDGDIWVETSSRQNLDGITQVPSQYFYGTKDTLTGDINGDGRGDLIAWNTDSTVKVMLGQGRGTTTKYSAPKTWSTSATPGVRNFVADVDGDGRDDLIAWNTANVYVSKSISTGFSAPVMWLGVGFSGTRASLVGDVNGDGRADLIAWNDTEIVVRKADSYGWFGDAIQWHYGGAFYGDVTNVVGDINGDGKADFVAWNYSSKWVLVSNASGLPLANDPPLGWNSGAFAGDRANLIGDVDGDGRADLVAWNSNSVWVEISQTAPLQYLDRFSSPIEAGVGSFYGDRANLLVVDKK